MAKQPDSPPVNPLEGVPVFDETIGGALIDAARITVVAAMAALPDVGPSILLPGDEDAPPTLHECLAQAATWLDHARAITVNEAAARGEQQTSVHIIHPATGQRIT